MNNQEETIVMCLYGDGEACEKSCPRFENCWGKK